MQQGDGGSIVNISSVSGMRPSPTSAAYGAAKAGLVNFTMTTAMEWAPAVRVNFITSGSCAPRPRTSFTATKQTSPQSTQPVPSDASRFRPRSATPASSSSPLASYVTGANLSPTAAAQLPFLDAANT